MKRIYGIILLLALIPFTVSAKELVVKDNDFKINVEGENYQSQNPILNVDQSTYLPLRELSALFGKDITYKDNTILIDTDYPEDSGQGNGEKHTIKSSLYPDAKQSTAKIIIGGKEYKPNNPVLLVNGTTYLSLRELANIFKEPIDFSNGTIYIKGEKPEIQPEEITKVPGKDEEKIKFTVVDELILREDGTLWAYGNNKGGRLSASVKEEHIPQPIKIMDAIQSISGGNNNYFILRQDHTLWMLDDKLTKVMDNVAEVRPQKWGAEGTIVTRDGELYIYGVMSGEFSGSFSNEFAKAIGAQKAKSDEIWDEYKFQLYKVKGISGVKDAMYMGEFLEPGPNGFGSGNLAEALIILKEDNSLWGWHQYNEGTPIQWGGMNSIQHIMDDVKSLESVGFINAVIKNDNSLWAWGATIYGAFGRELEDEVKTPIKLLDNVKMTDISQFTSFAVTNKGELYTWGVNQAMAFYGNSKPDIYKIGSNVEKIIADFLHFVALKTDGTVWMYGWDSAAETEESYDAQGNYIEKDKDMIGAFGTGDVRKNIGYYKFHSAEPLKGALDIGISQGEMTATYALKPDGNVWVWGTEFVLKGESQTDDEKKQTRVPRPFIVK